MTLRERLFLTFGTPPPNLDQMEAAILARHAAKGGHLEGHADEFIEGLQKEKAAPAPVPAEAPTPPEAPKQPETPPAQ
jgi:hypothetical protein